MAIRLERGKMIYIWFSWCHCHLIISCFIKTQNGFSFLLLGYQGWPGKEAIKRVFVCLYWFNIEPVSKVCKKTKPSTKKGAFASIFRKANQREMSKASPGRQKASVTTKVTTKTGSFTGIVFFTTVRSWYKEVGYGESQLPASRGLWVENKMFCIRAGSVLKLKPRFSVKTEPKPKPRFWWGSKSILRPH